MLFTRHMHSKHGGCIAYGGSSICYRKIAQAAFIGICYNVMEEQGMGCPEGGTRVGLSKAACATGAMVAL